MSSLLGDALAYENGAKPCAQRCPAAVSEQVAALFACATVEEQYVSLLANLGSQVVVWKKASVDRRGFRFEPLAQLAAGPLVATKAVEGNPEPRYVDRLRGYLQNMGLELQVRDKVAREAFEEALQNPF